MTRYAVSGADRTAREWAANRLRQRALIAVGYSLIDWTVDPPVLDFPWTLSANELALLGSISQGASTATVPMAGVVTTTGGVGGGAHPDLAAHDQLGLATQAELDAHTHPGGSHTHVWGEIPSGVVDGANATFGLAAVPAALMVFKNGLLQQPGQGNDYTLAGQVVTFLAGNVPQPGDVVLASYTT